MPGTAFDRVECNIGQTDKVFRLHHVWFLICTVVGVDWHGLVLCGNPPPDVQLIRCHMTLKTVDHSLRARVTRGGDKGFLYVRGG